MATDKKHDLDLYLGQLDRVLGFFSRVDSKASFLFAIDTGLLALIAINLDLADLSRWYLALPAIAALLLVIGSLWFVYQCNFPSLKGGAGSLIYFRSIAQRTESAFIDEFQGATEEVLARDVLAQTWRNAEILKAKFDAIKVAFVLTMLALVPWFVLLVLTTIAHAKLPNLG